MEKIKVTITCALSSIYIFINNLFGIFTPLVLITTIAMLSDLLTRLYAVSMHDDEKIESRKVLQGLGKKLGLCLLICITLTMDAGLMIIAETLDFEVAIHTVFTGFTLAWILVRELISNLENLAYAGVALPQFVVKALNTAKDKIDSNADKGGVENANTTKAIDEESIQPTWCEDGPGEERRCPLGGQCEYYVQHQDAWQKLKYDVSVALKGKDQELEEAVKKIVRSGIKLDINSWSSQERINLKNVPALLTRLGGLEQLVARKIISSKDLWIQGRYNANHVRSLLIKYAKAI